MESESPFEWPPLESNPDVFTEYMQSVGLPTDWVITQAFGLDDECLGFVPKPTVAVFATFELLDKEDRKKGDASIEVPFYMK